LHLTQKESQPYSSKQIFLNKYTVRGRVVEDNIYNNNNQAGGARQAQGKSLPGPDDGLDDKPKKGLLMRTTGCVLLGLG
jgi:hypothetical protein